MKLPFRLQVSFSLDFDTEREEEIDEVEPSVMGFQPNEEGERN